MEIPQRKGIYLIIIFKISVTIFGAIILGVGLNSHYRSSWLTYNITRGKLKDSERDAKELLEEHPVVKLYQLCQFHTLVRSWGWKEHVMDVCPDTGMEQYFVAVIITTFILSFCGLMLLWARAVHMDMNTWQVIEVSYHGIFSVLLFAAGVVYIQSANEIRTFAENAENDPELIITLMTQTKITAGVFTIMQSLLYAIVAGLIGHRIKYKYESTF